MTDTQTAAEVEAEIAPPPQLPAVPDKHAAAVEKRQRKPLPATGLRNIATALAAVTAEVGVVAKQGYNKFHNYKYAAMGDVLQKLTPLIGKHGLIIVQTEAENGRKMLDDGRAVAVEYEFTIAHSSGEMWPDRPRQTGLCRCRDSKGGFDDKAFNKCHTAARKYFLLSLFQVATGEEDDADKEQTGNAARKPAPPAPNVMLPPHDPETGEITPPRETAADAASAIETDKPPVADAVPPFSHRVAREDQTLASAALWGTVVLEETWKHVPSEIKPVLKSALDRRHKPAAHAIDAAAEGLDE